MNAHGSSAYPEVIKKADSVKVLLDSIVKKLRRSTHATKTKEDSYSRRGHNDCAHTATPVDADTHIMSIEREQSQGESEENGDKSDED